MKDMSTSKNDVLYMYPVLHPDGILILNSNFGNPSRSWNIVSIRSTGQTNTTPYIALAQGVECGCRRPL